MIKGKEIKHKVSAAYANMLLTQTGCCNTGAASINVAGKKNLAATEIVSFGCGDPVALAGLKDGEVVLDLGSGAGRDCFLAAEKVGPSGKVIGIDMTPEMTALARENASKLGISNVDFRAGDIESLPLDDESVDVVISNCVINLAPDKDSAFREAFRVLVPGGRLFISDILLSRPATVEEQQNMEMYSGCVSGSIAADTYLEKIKKAGFVDLNTQLEQPSKDGQFWFSGSISAIKP